MSKAVHAQTRGALPTRELEEFAARLRAEAARRARRRDAGVASARAARGRARARIVEAARAVLDLRSLPDAANMTRRRLPQMSRCARQRSEGSWRDDCRTMRRGGARGTGRRAAGAALPRRRAARRPGRAVARHVAGGRRGVIADEPRGGGSFTLGCMPPHLAQPEANARFPELLRAVFELEATLAPDRPPSSSVAVNCNARFRPHRDSGAGAGQGVSLIVGLGDYAGGELFVEGEPIDIRYAPARFNGWKQRHWTNAFEGERFSLVWFTPLGCEFGSCRSLAAIRVIRRFCSRLFLGRRRGTRLLLLRYLIDRAIAGLVFAEHKQLSGAGEAELHDAPRDVNQQVGLQECADRLVLWAFGVADERHANDVLLVRALLKHVRAVSHHHGDRALAVVAVERIDRHERRRRAGHHRDAPRVELMLGEARGRVVAAAARRAAVARPLRLVERALDVRAREVHQHAVGPREHKRRVRRAARRRRARPAAAREPPHHAARPSVSLTARRARAPSRSAVARSSSATHSSTTRRPPSAPRLLVRDPAPVGAERGAPRALEHAPARSEVDRDDVARGGRVDARARGAPAPGRAPIVLPRCGEPRCVSGSASTSATPAGGAAVGGAQSDPETSLSARLRKRRPSAWPQNTAEPSSRLYERAPPPPSRARAPRRARHRSRRASRRRRAGGAGVSAATSPARQPRSTRRITTPARIDARRVVVVGGGVGHREPVEVLRVGVDAQLARGALGDEARRVTARRPADRRVLLGEQVRADDDVEADDAERPGCVGAKIPMSRLMSASRFVTLTPKTRTASSGTACCIVRSLVGPRGLLTKKGAVAKSDLLKIAIGRARRGSLEKTMSSARVVKKNCKDVVEGPSTSSRRPSRSSTTATRSAIPARACGARLAPRPRSGGGRTGAAAAAVPWPAWLLAPAARPPSTRPRSRRRRRQAAAARRRRRGAAAAARAAQARRPGEEGATRPRAAAGAWQIACLYGDGRRALPAGRRFRFDTAPTLAPPGGDRALWTLPARGAVRARPDGASVLGAGPLYRAAIAQAGARAARARSRAPSRRTSSSAPTPSCLAGSSSRTRAAGGGAGGAARRRRRRRARRS